MILAQALTLILWCIILPSMIVDARKVTISNSKPRLDVDGNIIDCHSGNVIYRNGTYFMYGERYGNNTGFNTVKAPHIGVYTSPDMENWTDRGLMLVDAPVGTYFTPTVIFNERTQMFVVWFNAYMGGCCSGNFGVAQSKDGVVFDIVSLNEQAYYEQVDSNGLFVDADGTAYIIYSSLAQDHKVSIEKLTPDYLHTTKENYGLFPDRYVEGPVLYSHNGYYYASYGSCCCFCRAGSGVVVFRSTNVKGPWERMGTDKNCNTTTNPVCGGYGDRNGDPLIINAQGIGLSLLPVNGAEKVVTIWHGERWLSAPDNNPTCPDECRPETGICKEPPSYIKGHGYAYWIPLVFTEDNDIERFAPFVDSFELDLVY